MNGIALSILLEFMIIGCQIENTGHELVMAIKECK
jgi:hypothetical protein